MPFNKDTPSKMDERGLFKAIYTHRAEDSNELSFKKGEIVTLIERVEESGWCKGFCHGNYGLYPNNYVEPYYDPSRIRPSKSKIGQNTDHQAILLEGWLHKQDS